jgi:ketosteroid isomerase-like protein
MNKILLTWLGKVGLAALLTIGFGFVTAGASAQETIAAQKAFAAWEKGEKTGNYADFQALISPEFEVFSHPVQPARGVFTGTQARDMMLKLTAERRQNPNQLAFSNIRVHQSKNSFLFEFDSEGEVSGYPYKGWNAIRITIGTDNKVTSFREYLGDIDPAWFQKR